MHELDKAIAAHARKIYDVCRDKSRPDFMYDIVTMPDNVCLIFFTTRKHWLRTTVVSEDGERVYYNRDERCNRSGPHTDNTFVGYLKSLEEVGVNLDVSEFL